MSETYRTTVRPNPSRSGITDEFERITQLMCDHMRYAHGASACELCDEPCNNLEAQACARVAMALLNAVGVNPQVALDMLQKKHADRREA